MGILKLFEGTGDLNCVITTIKTPEGSMQKVVDGSSFSVGRAPDCVLSIPHAGVSRLHLLVTVKRGQVYIMDQESANGTFLNGQKIEAKKLIHIKPEDEIKLGLSDVKLQLGCLEKHFKTDYIAESLLPDHEKDNLQSLIRASNHKAQEIISAAQTQADHINQVSVEKARNLENQTLLKQEEIISAAQVEGQHIVAEAKRKGAQMLLENEEQAKSDTKHIHDQADRIRKEAESYFQNHVKDAERRGTEIIEQHKKLGQELVEDLKEKTIEKTQNEVRQQMATVITEIEEKSKYLKELQDTCSDYETRRKKEIEDEVAKIRADLLAQFEQEKTEKLMDLQGRVKNLEIEFNEKSRNLDMEYTEKSQNLESSHSARTNEIETEYNEKSQKLEADYTARIQSVETEYKEKSEGLESSYASRFKELEDGYKNKSESLESSYSKRFKELEDGHKEKSESLEATYSSRFKELEDGYKEKSESLETSYANRFKALEDGYSEKTSTLENRYKELSKQLDEDHRRKVEESEASIIQSKKALEKETLQQREELAQLTAELSEAHSKHNDVQERLEKMQSLLRGLQTSETDLIKSLNDKREQVKKADTDLQALKKEIDSQQERLFGEKQNLESQIDELSVRLSKVKAAFEAESDRLKKESEAEIAKYKEEQKKLKDQTDQIIRQEKAEIHKKTSDYMDAERVKLDEYRAQILSQKKELDHNFEKTRKEFEQKTKEAMVLEKTKIEEVRQVFLMNLNRQRQVITDEITIALMKAKNHSEELSSTSISESVGRVFNAHVTTLSVDAQTSSINQSTSKLKMQWMAYGLGVALMGFVGFKTLIQPQINRHIAGTEEHTKASIPVERPKYVAPQTLEYKDSYVDAVLYTQGFSQIYLDEQIHDKWFKHIAGYMYENWRVDETKSIEVVSIGKTMVQALKDSAANLDAEFFQKGIEKMRERESEAEKRMIDILGTKVKYEALKRKEKEFFEPYIQNQ